MRNLLDFIIRRSHWFVFLILEAFSLVMLFRFNNYQGSVYFTSANYVVGSIMKLSSDIASYLDLQTVNEGLNRDNVRLRDRVARLEAQLDSLSADTTRMHSAGTGLKYVDAKVVGATLHKNNNLMTIDKGRADGVGPEMGVVCSSGVVGIVYMSSDHYSIVVPLLNVKSSVSCRVKNTRYFGSLSWERGAVNIAYVTDVPRHAGVKRGEIVETSGYSAVFPVGIPIGQVLNVQDASDGQAYRLRIKLFTDFATLQNVSVITNYRNSEREALEHKADSLAINE